jgi:predicted esterase
MTAASALVAVALASVPLAGCDAGPQAIFDLHSTGDFYDLPFPDDAHLAADGTLDLARYPRVGGLPDQYIAAAAHDRGFGENEGIFFRFAGPLDPASLPADGAASLASSASAFVVDVTPGSPTYDRRTPVRARFVAEAYDFIGPNWLAVVPQPGFPLRERTTYAAVLTDGLRGVHGGRVRRSPGFDALLVQPDGVHAPLTAWLSTHPGLASHVVVASLFTTSDATSIMRTLRAAVYAQAPAPELDELVFEGADTPGIDDLYEGTYQSPNFQAGTPPYMVSGGNLVYDADGIPQVQRMETLRVAMTIPEGDMPPAGWPVVIYQHGTGGDYKSFVRDGSGREAALVNDASGAVIARLAMISTDEVLHGTRSPRDTDYNLAFFNFQNVAAAHDNSLQGALDDFQMLRLVKSIDVAEAPSPWGPRPIKFDPQRIYFKGHSQGGIAGPLFLAAEPEVKAAVLSGAGGVLIYSLLHKLKPVDIPELLQALLRDPVDEFHPLLNLVQGHFEDIDPENYGPQLFREPPPGQAPKSIFQSLGLVDTETPVANIEALALAMEVQPVKPELVAIDGGQLAGVRWAAAPVSGNVAGGAATGVLLQYVAPPMVNGHFVIFDVAAAIAQSNRFLATHATSGIARVDPP